jgi:hypothetical protein
MAEAVGFVASISTILDSCTSCLKLLRDIHGAPKDQAKLRFTISSVKGVVDELQETTSHAQTAPNISQLKTIPSLVEDGSPLACLQDTLASLEHKLNQIRSAKGFKKVGKRASWPFTKEDIKTTMGVLKLHLKTLGLAFQNDIFLVTQDIYKGVSTIQDHTNAILKESSIIRKDVEKVGVSLEILKTTSKDNVQHIERKILASGSKTSTDIGKIASQISMVWQENKQNLEKLQASIKQSGVRYTPQDFVLLERYRSSHNSSYDGKNDILKGDEDGDDDGDDSDEDDGDDSEEDDGEDSEEDDGEDSEEDDGEDSEEDDGDDNEEDDGDDNEMMLDGDDSEDDDGDDSEMMMDGDDEDANEEKAFSSANSGYRCSNTRYTEDEEGYDSEYYNDGGYSTT